MINDKTILIVGASTGVGRQVALNLSHYHNRIIICARSESLLTELAEQIINNGSQVLVCRADALNPLEAEHVIDNAHQQFGQIDIALLNVGAGPSISMSDVSVEQINDTMALNFNSMVNFLVPLIALFKRQKYGVLAHTNSLAGLLGLPKQGPYCAAKSACKLLLDSCRIELGQLGITFVSIYPGFVTTERVQQENGDLPSPFSISEQLAAHSSEWRYVYQAVCANFY